MEHITQAIETNQMAKMGEEYMHINLNLYSKINKYKNMFINK